MKTKFIFFLLTLFFHSTGFSQFIWVKAKYTESRLVDDSPNPPKRENRLILSFFEITGSGTYVPISVSNYDVWITKVALQYGSFSGGVLDSSGNNYPGYAWTAPKAVFYSNTYSPSHYDCVSTLTTHYVANGHYLDCGFVTVSYWDVDNGTGNAFEAFSAPNIHLPLYEWPEPLRWFPYSLCPFLPMAPYNLYFFQCGGTQTAVRGVLAHDSFQISLPVRFANVKGEVSGGNSILISWSNLTESEIFQYEVESSADGNSFERIGIVQPSLNNGNRADYTFLTGLETGKTYYRIKATENNGSSFYSIVITIQRYAPVEQQHFFVYPNPASGNQVTFQLTKAEPGRYLFFVVNPFGMQIKQKLVEHTGGDITRQVDMTGLTTGLYQFTLQSSSKKYSQTIVYVK